MVSSKKKKSTALEPGSERGATSCSPLCCSCRGAATQPWGPRGAVVPPDQQKAAAGDSRLSGKFSVLTPASRPQHGGSGRAVLDEGVGEEGRVS